MKTAIALLAVLVLSGCSTQLGVDNSQNNEASYSNVTGILTTRYTADTTAVFNAVKRTIDAMPGTLRTGETDESAIVITGYRASLQSAQNIKENADTFVDVITAEDIGALPDRSVAEALQRVPGVNIGLSERPEAGGGGGSTLTFGVTDIEAAKAALEEHGVRVGLGTDVGAGTSFSQLQSLNEAYKVMQLQGKKLDPFKSLYLATLGGANALYLDDKIGNFESGKDADFVVLDYNATPLISYRMQQAKTLDEKLFALTMLGDDRAIKETFAAGQSVHRRD